MNKSKSGTLISILFIIMGFILLILKLTGIIAWSYLAVFVFMFLPTVIGISIFAFIIVAGAIIFVIALIFSIIAGVFK